MTAEWVDTTEHIDISDLIIEMCSRLQIDPTYVYRMELRPQEATIYLFKGQDGFCKGRKYVIKDEGPYEGQAAEEPPLRLKITM
jgi:hypothetical protein